MSAPRFIYMGLREWFDKLRKASLAYGYTCDMCGKELFNYPTERICDGCEEKLFRPDKICPKCGRESVAEGICLTCKSHMPSFTQGVSPFSYKGEAALSVNRMKNGNPRLAAYLGEQMAEKFLESRTVADGDFLILPVPLTQERLRVRGYNQAERLAESVEKRLVERGFEVELDNEVLQKRRETKLQKQASAKARTENVQGAYHVHKRMACKGKSILLIDDIMTTGATGSECAKLLLSAGAREVILLTAAALPEKK